MSKSLKLFILSVWFGIECLDSNSQIVIGQDPNQNFSGLPGTCAPLPCQTDPCNLIRNGGFEQYSLPCVSQTVGVTGDCWSVASPTPDMMVLGCTGAIGTVLPYAQSGNNYMGFGAFIGSYNESVQAELTQSLVPNETYLLSVLVSKSSTFHPAEMCAVDIYLGQDFNCNLTGTPQENDLFVVSSDVFPIVDVWSYFEIEFTPDQAYDVIFLRANATIATANSSSNQCYLFVDDLTLINGDDQPNFALPELICASAEPVLLSNYVTDPTTEFLLSDGVVLMNGSFYFDPTNLLDGDYTVTAIQQTMCGLEIPHTEIIHVDNPIFSAEFVSCLNNGSTTTIVVPPIFQNVTYSPTSFLNPSSGNEVICSPSSSMNYIASGLTSNGCTVNMPISIYVDEFPQLAIVVSDESICIGESTQLTASGAANYVWTATDDIANPTDAAISVSPIETSTYQLNGTATNGCESAIDVEIMVEEVCCSGSTLPPPSFEISMNETWLNEVYILNENLIIAAGVHFIIDGCNLQFAQGKGIVLLDGADLTIRNESYLSTIVDCDGFWSGISASRVTNYGANVNKSLIVINSGSVIERASVGLKLKTLNNPDGEDATQDWAHVIVDGSTFLNCQRDFEIRGLYKMGTLRSYILGYISSSEFITDDSFPEGELPSQNKSFFQYSGKAIPFFDCKIINTIGSHLSAMEFIGLKYDHFPVSYISYTSNATGLTASSSISGFTRGIWSRGKGNVNIRGTDFSCWRDMYVRNTGIHYIVNNEFATLQNDVLSGLQNGLNINGSGQSITAEDFVDLQICPYGLYLDGVCSYTVQDNLFDVSFTNPWINNYSHGLLINNTGDASNRIRRNYFVNMGRALKLQGDNRYWDMQLGTKYSCNYFGYYPDNSIAPNFTDIRELSSPFTSANSWGVPHQVSSGVRDPNNRWQQSNCGYCQFDDIANSVNTHNYMRSSTNPFEPLTLECTSNVIFPINFLTILDDCLNSSSMPTINSASSNCNLEKLSAESAYLETKSIYDLVVDGGNTDYIVDEIESTDFSAALQTYYTLMQLSPALSETAMIAALQQHSLPNILLAQILASNPSAAKSDEIKGLIDNRLIPFSEYEKEQIMLGLNLWSQKENLEAAMSGQLSLRGSAIQCQFFEIDNNDQIQNKLTSKLSLLDETNFVGDMWIKCELLAAVGRYQDATDLLYDADNNFILSNSDKIDQFYMIELLGIQKAVQLSPSQNLGPVSISKLEDMLGATSAVVATKALELLIQTNHYSYTEPIEDEEQASLRSLRSKKQSSIDYTLKIYPNPSENLVILEYKKSEVAKISILDVIGREVLSIKTSSSATQFAIDLHDLTIGSYLVRLYDPQGSFIETAKLVKQ